MTALALPLFTDPDVDTAVADAIDTIHQLTGIYTADPVVEEVLRAVGWPHLPGCLLDTGLGDGQFLVKAVEMLGPTPNGIEGLAARVEGWELHPEAVAAARTRLRQQLLAAGWTDGAAVVAATQVIKHADFLAPGPRTRRYSVIAANPPYLRWNKVPAVRQATYADQVPAYAQKDLLFAFLDRAADVLLDDGRLGLVTSDRWLFTASGAPLRTKIGQRFGIETIRRLDSASTFYRPKIRKAGSPARVHPVSIILTPKATASAPLTAAPVYPADADQTLGAPALHLHRTTRTLGDVATVRIGPWLGPAGVFYMEREAAQAAGIPETYLVPAVEAAHCRQETAAPTSLVAVRTEGVGPLPASIMAHLERHAHLLSPRAKKRGFGNSPEGWGALPLATPSLIVPRVVTHLRVVRLEAGILPLNHNLNVVSATGALSLDELAAQITSPAAQAWLRATAPRIENGFYTINTNQLRAMPLFDHPERRIDP